MHTTHNQAWKEKYMYRKSTGIIGMANNEAPSFRKIPERSSMPGAFFSSKYFSILNTLCNF